MGTLAQSLDKSYADDKTPPTMFFQPEDADHQLACVVMEVLQVLQIPSKRSQHHLPAVVVKYYHGHRTWMTPARHDAFYKGLKRPGLLMQARPAQLPEVDLLHQVLRSNRKQLAQPVVEAAEKEWPTGWRYSVLVLDTDF